MDRVPARRRQCGDGAPGPCRSSRLDLVVGPNGVGKSTFIRLVIVPAWPAAIIVNAAEIAALRWPDDPSAHAYDAARIAADTRTRLIDLGRPPIAETVFSHRSQLDLVRQASQAGYAVALHVLMVPEDLSVARVAYRAAAGSHDVPVDKIRQRHRRLSSIVAAAVPLADSATFWENSRQEDPCIVGLFSEGLAVGYPDWPSWAPDVLVDRRPSRR